MPEGYQGLPPFYVQSSSPITPNLGLSLKGADPVVAENFYLIDTAFGSISASIEVNGSVVANPNFNNTTPAAPSGYTNVLWQYSGSSVSAYVATGGGGGTPGLPYGSVQGNNAGVFGGVPGTTCDFTNGTISISPTGTGVALTVTGDAHSSDALDIYGNVAVAPLLVVQVTNEGNFFVQDTAGDAFSITDGVVKLGVAGGSYLALDSPDTLDGFYVQDNEGIYAISVSSLTGISLNDFTGGASLSLTPGSIALVDGSGAVFQATGGGLTFSTVNSAGSLLFSAGSQFPSFEGSFFQVDYQGDISFSPYTGYQVSMLGPIYIGSQLLDTNTPPSPGTSGQVLTSTGTGVLWANVGVTTVPLVTKSGNYTLLATDYVVIFTATATATLNSSLSAGQSYRIKFTGSSGAVTLSPSSGTIDGQASITMGIQYDAIDVVFDGTNWWLF